MANKPKATIRKNSWDNWRCYIGGVLVKEFWNSSQETAERAAKRWLAAQNEPQMATASDITINTNGITDEQKATEKFQSAYRDMMAQLLAPGFIPVLCAHEAAHMLYFGSVGAKEFESFSSGVEI